jgi:hypothetical protein
MSFDEEESSTYINVYGIVVNLSGILELCGFFPGRVLVMK